MCPQGLETKYVAIDRCILRWIPCHASPPAAKVVKLWDPPAISEYWSMEGTGVGWSTKADSSTMAKLFTPHIVFME